MEVKKRNGQRVPFKEEKIIQAIKNANSNIEEKDRLSDPEILFIANQIKANILNNNETWINVLTQYISSKKV